MTTEPKQKDNLSSKEITDGISGCISIIVIIILLIYFDFFNIFKKEDISPQPIPISITFREGITGGVLQIHKTNSKKIICNLKVFDMYGTEVVNYPFYISEHADKTEIGKMEIGRKLLIGDHGTITAQGYTKQARFIIQSSGEERYVTWKIVD